MIASNFRRVGRLLKPLRKLHAHTSGSTFRLLLQNEISALAD